MNKSYVTLKTYAYVFTSSAICWCIYVDNTYGNSCTVYVIYYSFSVSVVSIQNAEVQSTH
jgi:hypothetical protein